VGGKHRRLVRPRSPVRRRGLIALGAVLVFGAAAVGPAPALAQAPAATCPDAPGAYGGSDDVVAELRALRADLAAACAAQLDRADDVRDSLHGDLSGLGDTLAGRLKVQLDAGPGTAEGARLFVSPDAGADADHPSYVEQTNPTAAADLEPVAQRVEDSGEALRSTLWFVAGLLSVLIVAPLVAREVRA
jgi:hypothetical protein